MQRQFWEWCVFCEISRVGYIIKMRCSLPYNFTFIRYELFVVTVKMVKIGVHLRKLSQN